MSPEPPVEQQIMMQLLGPDFGRVLFAFTTLVGNAAQMQVQLNEQAEKIQMLEAALPKPEPMPAPENPWTGPTNGQATPEAVAAAQREAP